MTKCISSFYLDYKFEHDRMIKSLLHFHPEANLEILDRDEVLKLNLGTWAYPIIELPLFKRYTTVTHIDADVLVLDRIDELFDSSTDVRAGRNNSDNNRSAVLPGITLGSIGWEKYVNVGVHSVSSEAFMWEWFDLCVSSASKYQYGENGTFNIIFYSGKYISKLLDPIESNVHYGSSTIEGTKTYWDIWKEIVVAGDHLELKGKRIKMLHWAGNCPKPPISDLVTKPVLEFIEEIIN